MAADDGKRQEQSQKPQGLSPQSPAAGFLTLRSEFAPSMPTRASKDLPEGHRRASLIAAVAANMIMKGSIGRRERSEAMNTTLTSVREPAKPRMGAMRTNSGKPHKAR